MSRLSRFAGGLRALLGKRRTDAELDEELCSYVEAASEEKMRVGMSRADARRAARAEFGSVEAVKDYVRDAGWESAADSMKADLCFAVRIMRRNPSFTAIVLLTLALGIGANTALFTVVNAVLLAPLPVKNPNELTFFVWDWRDNHMWAAQGFNGTATSDNSPTGNLEGTSFPYLTYERMRAEKGAFASVFAFSPIAQLNLIADGIAEVASGQYVTGDYYSGLGVPPWRGRMLTELDDRPGAPPAAVITWRYWQRRFNGEAGALGKIVTINAVKFTIVGVSPPEFVGTLEPGEAADVTIPLATDPLVHPGNASIGKPALWWLRMMARLAPGVGRVQAQARTDAIFQASAIDAWKADSAAQTRSGQVDARDYPRLLLTPGARGDQFARRQYRQPLALLMGVVGLALLIACINVANLLLAGSSARQQEFAMRAALGASRWRLIRQLLTESLLLSAMAASLGFILAMWAKAVLLHWASWMRGGAALEAGVDARVLAFTVGISALTGILFGLAPAMRAGATRLLPTVKTQIGVVHRRALLARLLIVAQVAASLVLLVAAALFLRTLRNLHTVETGFDTNNLLLFRVRPESNGYSAATVGPLYDRMIERLNSIPGVKSVSLSRHPLLSLSHLVLTVWVKPGDPNNGERAEINVISPSFFETMRMPVLLGRPLRDSDTATAARVVVVNQTFARTYFPGVNPIGQRFWLGGGGEGTGNPRRRPGMARPDDNAMEIVGVARDAKYTDLRTRVKPTVYQSYQQSPSLQANFELRYAGSLEAIAPVVRVAVQQVDPRLPIFDLRTQAEQSDASLGEETMFAKLASAMGGLTLLLAAVGLYGIMSNSVRRRTAEIGVRMALGAQQGEVFAMVVRESLVLVAGGLIVGVPAALASTKAASNVLSDLLFGIQPTDPLSLALAVGTMIAVALLAGYVPARRATRVEPMVALRHE